MTPAERLLAAADLLDKRAGEATKGNWAYELMPERWEGDRPAHWVRYKEDSEYGYTSGTVAECPWGERDARYIATMHPEVGKALAETLRQATDDLIDTPGTWTQHTLCARFIGHPDEVNQCRHLDPILRLADLILAGES